MPLFSCFAPFPARRSLFLLGTVLPLLSLAVSVPLLSGCGSSARERISALNVVASREVAVGDQIQLSAQVSGASTTDLIWTVEKGGGSFSPTTPGLFTAPDTAASVRVKATLRSDPSRSNDAFITVRPKITLTPSVAGVFPGLTVNLAGVLSGASEGLKWAVEGVEGDNTNGTLVNVTGNSAQYVAPLTPGVYTVRAFTADGAVVKTVSLVVQARGTEAVLISPRISTAQTGQTVQLTAEVPGADTSAVTWTSSGGGLITDDGKFTSDTPGIYTVTATSVQNPGLSSTATVTVTAPVSPPTPLVVQPVAGTTVASGAGVSFSANRPVTWSVLGPGTISESGFYQSPAGAVGSVIVTATPSDGVAGVSPVSVPLTIVGGPTPPPTTPGTPTTPTTPAVLSVYPNPIPDTQAGGTLPFSASQAVTWSVSGGGSITTSGFFTAPATVPASGTVTVTATPTGAGIAPVSVTVNITAPGVPPPSTFAVARTPSGDVTVGGGINFSASRSVTWSVEEPGFADRIDPATGVFTAPATVPGTPDGTLTVKATATDPNFTPVLTKVKIVPRGAGSGTVSIN